MSCWIRMEGGRVSTPPRRVSTSPRFPPPPLSSPPPKSGYEDECGEGPGLGYNVNVPLSVTDTTETLYMDTLKDVLDTEVLHRGSWLPKLPPVALSLLRRVRWLREYHSFVRSFVHSLTHSRTHARHLPTLPTLCLLCGQLSICTDADRSADAGLFGGIAGRGHVR